MGSSDRAPCTCMPSRHKRPHCRGHGTQTYMVIPPKNAVNDGTSNFKDGKTRRPRRERRVFPASRLRCPEHKTAHYVREMAEDIRSSEPRRTKADIACRRLAELSPSVTKRQCLV